MLHKEAEEAKFRKKSYSPDPGGTAKLVAEGFGAVYEVIEKLLKRIKNVEEVVNVTDWDEHSLGNYLVIVVDDDKFPFEVYKRDGKRMGLIEAFDDLTTAVTFRKELVGKEKSNA